MQQKVLIMEDEEVLGKLYQKKLEKAGFETLWLDTINKTEEQLPQFMPDIVLLDHSISGEEQSGMDLIPFVRKLLPKSKIVMLSNYSDFHLKEKALEAGADDYLVKIDNPPNIIAKYLLNKTL